MKLNTELIRELLLYIEENSDGRSTITDINIPRYTEDEIDYHLSLLEEEKYIVAKYVSFMHKGKSPIPLRLTMLGHSYLENVRNKYIWLEIKRDIEVKGIKTVSLDIIKDFANKFIRKRLEI